MQLQMQPSPQLKQTVTTELIQQLELLQLSTPDLWKHVEEKVLENPLLELNDKKLNKEILKGLTFQQNKRSLTQEITSPKHSKMSLYEQIPLKNNFTQKQIHILKYLIESLDHHLFLTIQTEEVAYIFNVPQSEVKKMQHYLQCFEPYGIGFSNSIEFMVHQLEHYPVNHKYIIQFVREELNAIARQDIHYLSGKYQLSRNEVLEAIACIKSLQPFPIHAIDDVQVQHIIPDIELKKVDGMFCIELNQNALPNITFNFTNMELLKSHKEAKTYYKERLKTAQFLINGIEERKKTLFNIMNVLLDKQRGFFEKGPSAVQPLTLNETAEVLNLHESTISRAIRDKYFLFENQIYPFKYLFQKGIQTDDTKGITSDYVKRCIQALIKNENVQRPFSDQQIVEWLKKQNVKIARRTVTKYREEMLIPSSKNRKM